MNPTLKSFFFYLYMLLLLCLILSSGGYVIYKIYVGQVNPCTSNPLVYASNKWIEDYGHQLEGSGSYLDADGESFIVTFNSTGYSIRDANDGFVLDIEQTPNFTKWYQTRSINNS